MTIIPKNHFSQLPQSTKAGKIIHNVKDKLGQHVALRIGPSCNGCPDPSQSLAVQQAVS